MTRVSGNTAYSNGGDGMHACAGVTVSDHTVRDDTGYGINFPCTASTDSAYSGNVISGNTAGTVAGPAVEFGQNARNGNTTRPR